jgi:tetratricopeptide (TPR) repeat protein
LAIISHIDVLKLDVNNADARLALLATQAMRTKEKGLDPIRGFIAQIKAKIHTLLRNPQAAMLDMEAAITNDPSNARLLLQFSNTALDAGFRKVAIWQRRSISDNIAPSDLDNLWTLADLYHRDNQDDEAIRMLERVKKLDPVSDVDGQIRAFSAQASTQIFERAKDTGGARAIIKDAGEAERLELDAGRLRTDEQRRKAIDFRLEHDPKERPKDYAIWIAVGQIATEMTDLAAGYAEARKYFTKAQELAPENAAVREHLGDLEMRRYAHEISAAETQAQSGDEATVKRVKKLKRELLAFQVSEYERRAKEQPMKNDYHYKLGSLYWQFKRYDEAIGELQVSAKDPRWRVRSLTLLGRCMLANHNVDMAISQFQRAWEGVEIFDKHRTDVLRSVRLAGKRRQGRGKESVGIVHPTLYETDIRFRDVKDKVAEAQKAAQAEK